MTKWVSIEGRIAGEFTNSFCPPLSTGDLFGWWTLDALFKPALHTDNNNNRLSNVHACAGIMVQNSIFWSQNRMDTWFEMRTKGHWSMLVGGYWIHIDLQGPWKGGGGGGWFKDSPLWRFGFSWWQWKFGWKFGWWVVCRPKMVVNYSIWKLSLC